MNKGFTLIELMIVVAIIGVLVVVGIPACKKFFESSSSICNCQCPEKN